MSLAIAPSGPQVGDQQRLGATMVLSLLLHGMLVLGLGFTLDDAAPVTPALDVILTETTSPLTQGQADFLAQATNQGGGEHDQARRPRESQLGLAPRDEPGFAPEPLRAQSPDARPPPQARIVSSRQGEHAEATPDPTPQAEDSLLPPGEQHIERDEQVQVRTRHACRGTTAARTWRQTHESSAAPAQCRTPV